MASGWAGLDFAWQLLAFRAGFCGFNNFEQIFAYPELMIGLENISSTEKSTI